MRAVVTDAQGSVSLEQIAGATLEGNDEGLEICSVSDDIDFEGAQLSNVIIALQENFAAALATKAAGASRFEAHPLTWSHNGQVFRNTRGTSPATGGHRRMWHAYCAC